MWCQGVSVAAVVAMATSAALVGCYSPSPQPGSPCDTTHPCPTPLVCSPATQTCERDDSGVDAAVDDGGPDDDAPQMDASLLCYGTGFVRPCLTAEPTGELVISTSVTLDTSAASACTAITPEGYCVLAVAELVINDLQVLRAIGSRPLVIVATDSIKIFGSLHVGSDGATRGAGSNPAACTPGQTASVNGGGPGGSFVGLGGRGGTQTGVGAAAVPGPVAATVSSLRGGCDGGSGNGASPGLIGLGGGAVALISPSIVVDGGFVRAFGSGGGQSGFLTGGSGGGSGGMIVLDAPTISIIGTSYLYANGGGGAEGGGGQNMGNAGADPPATPAIPQGGAGNAAAGGDGGDGTAGAKTIGTDGQDGASTGGGGGGGIGVIKVFPLQSLPMTSPPPT